MSSIKYSLKVYIDGSETSDFALTSDGPFQAFHAGDQFVPDPNVIDRPGTGFKIAEVLHRLFELSGTIAHVVELELSSFTK